MTNAILLVKDINQKPEPDEIEIVIFAEKTVHHYIERFNSEKDWDFQTTDNKSYKIRKNMIIKKEPSLIQKIKNILPNIPKLPKPSKVRNSYVIFFEKDKEEPFSINYTEPKINARQIFIALRSENLRKGVESIQFGAGWSLPLNKKTLILIGAVILVIVVLGYEFSQGMIHL